MRLDEVSPLSVNHQKQLTFAPPDLVCVAVVVADPVAVEVCKVEPDDAVADEPLVVVVVAAAAAVTLAAELAVTVPVTVALAVAGPKTLVQRPKARLLLSASMEYRTG